LGKYRNKQPQISEHQRVWRLLDKKRIAMLAKQVPLREAFLRNEQTEKVKRRRSNRQSCKWRVQP